MDAADCQPDFCLDLFDPSGNNKSKYNQSHILNMLDNNICCFNAGHGRKRRAIDDRNATEYAKFKENLEYTVLMPGEFSNGVKLQDQTEQCKNFVMISALLAGLLALSTIIVRNLRKTLIHQFQMNDSILFSQTCGLASKLQGSGRKTIGNDYSNQGYAGRAVLQ